MSFILFNFVIMLAKKYIEVEEVPANYAVIVPLCIVMAVIGSSVKYLNTYEKFENRKFIVALITSIFIAVTTSVLLREFTDVSDAIVVVICGIFGWGGVSVLDFFVEAIKSQISKTLGDTDIRKDRYKEHEHVNDSEF
jgi:glycopeptide antibiotics resistance protein|nr:MAG TPA: LydA holin phage, holin superfamily III [Caudoviricetes sp.]